MEAAEHDQLYQASPYSSSHYYPSHPHLGVSDQDWNEAREELAHLGIDHHSPRDTYHDDPSLSSVYQHRQHQYQEPYSQFSHHAGFSSDLALDSEEHYHHSHLMADSDSHSLYSPSHVHNSSSHRSLSDEHPTYGFPPSAQSHEFPLRNLSPIVHTSSSSYDHDGQQTPWNRQPGDVRFEEHHPSSTTNFLDTSLPLSSASDYTEFPYDDDHHHHLLSDNLHRPLNILCCLPTTKVRSSPILTRPIVLTVSPIHP
ncbi:hypothetical protein VP01_1250g2 [Puccinia sorghi]|uniref:Uncharacterized protein n=1 Tax=Puccinia sorghi TaxID=27349 RepID=A0A0L6VPP2_9BASI|nr:hypothetical protein VP01_1250g2 [Puccinia sorghi]